MTNLILDIDSVSKKMISDMQFGKHDLLHSNKGASLFIAMYTIMAIRDHATELRISIAPNDFSVAEKFAESDYFFAPPPFAMAVEMISVLHAHSRQFIQKSVTSHEHISSLSLNIDNHATSLDYIVEFSFDPDRVISTIFFTKQMIDAEFRTICVKVLSI